MIHEFYDILNRFGIDPTPEEVAEILWMARHMAKAAPPSGDRTESETGDDRITGDMAPDEETTDGPVFPREQPQEEPPKEAEKDAGVYPPDSKKSDVPGIGTGGIPVRVPGAPALPGKLAIGRSLRPLMRKAPSKSRMALDVEATVRRIAESDIWLPVLKPESSRWLDAVIVADESPSMLVWRETISELKELLEEQGAFRDVQIWSFRTDDRKRTVRLYKGRGPDISDSEIRDPRELIDPKSRRLILVVSDCASPAWQSGWIAELLNAWTEKERVAILQMLPHWLWDLSGLGAAEPVYLKTRNHETINADLEIMENPLGFEQDVSQGSKLPVVTLESCSLFPWAKSVVGMGEMWIPGVVMIHQKVKKTTSGPSSENEADSPPKPEKLLEHFESVASPEAQELAGYLAAVPLTMPIMRLVQQEMLPESGLVHLAEIFLCGLIERQTYDDESTHPDEVVYEFADGLRDILVDQNLISETLKILSIYIEKHLRTSIADFTAMIAEREISDDMFNGKPRLFAEISVKTLERLGLDLSRIKKANVKSKSDNNIEPVVRTNGSDGGISKDSEPRETINWLHFSDLHAGVKANDWQWPVCREIFLNDLTRMHETAGGFDLILFTGDLAFSGQKEEFEKTEKILTEIINHLKKLGSSPMLLAVPGNHDLMRQDAMNPISLAMSRWSTSEELREHFWETKRSDYRKLIFKAFEPFIEFRDRWIQNYKYRENSNLTLKFGELPGDFFATFKKNGISIGLAGFNSAFIQVRGGDAKGKLEISPRQFNPQSMGCDFPAWIKKHNANLLMTHHPADWLYPEAFEIFQATVDVPGRFAAHLHGHCHDSDHLSIKSGGAETRTVIQGTSLFGSKKLNNGKKSRIHGYNAGQIKVQENKGILKVWPRRLSLRKGNFFEIGPDHTLPLTDKNYISNEFKLVKPYDPDNGKSVVLYYGGRGNLEKKIQEILLSSNNQIVVNIDLAQFSETPQAAHTFLRAIVRTVGDEKEKIEDSLQNAKDDADRRFGALKYEPTTSPHVLDPWSQHYMGHVQDPFFRWLIKCQKDRSTPFIFLFDHFERISDSLQWIMEFYLFPGFNSLKKVKCVLFYKGNQQPSWKTFIAQDYVEIKANINLKLTEFRNPYMIGRPIKPLQSDMLYGRRDIADLILRGLSDGRNAFAISASLKIGKSSFLLSLENLVPKDYSDKYLPVYLDLVAIEKPDEKHLKTKRLMWFLAYEIHKAVQQEVKLDISVPRLKDFSEMPIRVFNDNFLGDKILRRLEDGRKILLLIDDFDAINNWIEEGEKEPEFFRFLGQHFQHQDRLAFVFSGSMKLKKLADRFPKFFNSVQFLEMGLLSEKDTRKLILSPVEGVLEYEPEAIDDILEMSGLHPYITQAICHTIVNQVRKNANTYITSQDLKEMTKNFLNEAHGVFKWIWNSCNKTQQEILMRICTENDFNHIVDIDSLEIDGNIQAALNTLWKMHILRSSRDARFASYLFYLWVKRKYSSKELL